MRERREFFRIDADVPVLIRAASSAADQCLCRLSTERFGEAAKIKLRRRINISGAGICFGNDSPNSPDEIIEMRLMLEDVYPGTIVLCTKVLRTEKMPKNYCVAVEYVGLTEEIRELIVKFVFHRERTLIQEKRVGWL
jgi:c-di-GMP-binding flagellar brake protein YcgR